MQISTNDQYQALVAVLQQCALTKLVALQWKNLGGTDTILILLMVRTQLVPMVQVLHGNTGAGRLGEIDVVIASNAVLAVITNIWRKDFE